MTAEHKRWKLFDFLSLQLIQEPVSKDNITVVKKHYYSMFVLIKWQDGTVIMYLKGVYQYDATSYCVGATCIMPRPVLQELFFALITIEEHGLHGWKG